MAATAESELQSNRREQPTKRSSQNYKPTHIEMAKKQPHILPVREEMPNIRRTPYGNMAKERKSEFFSL